MGLDGPTDEQQAATKIQAIHRGKADRAYVEDKRAMAVGGGGEQPMGSPGTGMDDMDHAQSWEERPETEMAYTQPEAVPEVPVWPSYCNPAYIMPSVISVSVRRPGGAVDTYEVSIEKAAAPTPYLGGYRHKKTGFKYHHACSQTPSGLDKRIGWNNPESKHHRDTQTYETKTRSQMTQREYGTQMKRKDLYMDDAGDNEIVARPYFSAAQLHELKRDKTLVIQCYYRGYVARKRTWAMREALYLEHLAEREAAEKSAAANEKRRQYEVERRMNPKSLTDFELLYNELEAWRQKEMAAISALNLTDAEYKERMNDLLAKQSKALQTIDRLKVDASKHGHQQRVGRMLELMSKPKLWELGNGEVQEVHTASTERAQELMELYQGLNDTRLAIDERLDVLLNTKWTAKDFDCPLTRDIVELCDREAEMLNRGRSEATLGGLRKRLSNLFLQFVETPDFNPEAARFLKTQQPETTRMMSSTM
mmetsp:Transcript_59218/g.163507  ORF Transcript_59218/g.163507 Transcript_59218/m.163507 type:complete len:479 (+) Transcript_59218:214-1650(+)|eukprot:CAMPEP_0119541650 /NCGR_PEP_ID=MMETSP1344-20130328/53092_1 /TAXON_ID=236787 /ORGANISM="Florenciella parvula, Strain CCMP2471" /LENGTH=478 /DNA_ID=CAMNT_0007585679 /DNA_START=218 /DNA_END=1654 /DNA_ORIENTATION=+